MRVAIVAIALNAVERTLAQGEPSPKALATLQQLLEQEDREPLLLTMARGERAISERLMQAMYDGTFKTGQLPGLDLGMIGRLGVGSVTVNRVVSAVLQGSLSRGHAVLLRYHNRLVEIAQLPETELKSRFEALEQEVKSAAAQPLNLRVFLVKHIAPAMGKVWQALQRHHARLRSAYVAVALERYRQQHDRWPDSLQQLIPGLIERVPLDPYDGALLRYRPLADGVVVYSVGPDGKDNGGNLLANPYAPGADIGFRLWNVPARRQPASMTSQPKE